MRLQWALSVSLLLLPSLMRLWFPARQQEVVETLEQVARRHSLTPYATLAGMERGQLLIAAGHPAEGVELIRRAVDMLNQCRYKMVTSVALASMAKGLSDMSLHAAALETCDEVEILIRRGGDFSRMPYLLFVRGQAFEAAGRIGQSEQCYLAAIELARSQGVKSGQVRAGVTLAQQMMRTGRIDGALRLLRPLVEDAGDETSVDLSQARHLLSQFPSC